jgi:transcription antitermination factor NusG
MAPSIGDPVQMTDGPLMGMTATVTKILPGAERIQILIDFLGSPRQMEVSLNSLLGFGSARTAVLEKMR